MELQINFLIISLIIILQTTVLLRTRSIKDMLLQQIQTARLAKNLTSKVNVQYF